MDFITFGWKIWGHFVDLGVFLKVSLMRGAMMFGKKGKLSPQYVGPFEIIECMMKWHTD